METIAIVMAGSFILGFWLAFKVSQGDFRAGMHLFLGKIHTRLAMWHMKKFTQRGNTP